VNLKNNLYLYIYIKKGLTDEEVTKQKEQNKTAGLGQITDAKVKAQKEQNKTYGKGEYTDAELEQKEQNITDGKGEYTDAELKQKKENKQLWKKDITDAELDEQVKEKTANYEGIHAENIIYQKDLDLTPGQSNPKPVQTGVQTGVQTAVMYTEVSSQKPSAATPVSQGSETDIDAALAAADTFRGFEGTDLEL
jgi:hypothetical protein